MPHSLRVRLKNLQRKGELTEKDIDRIFKALEQEPCDDVVSRQAVLKIIDGWYEQNRDTENIEDLIVLITYMDSVRPQEQTGHWIRQDNTKEPLYGWYFCSECNSVIGDKTKFCSNCGAKMVEPQERSKE